MEHRQHDCLFCQIVAGSAPASVAWDDEQVMAFMDIAPVTDGHVLVVPKVHTAGLDDIDPEVAARMVQVGQKIARALKRSRLRCEGVNLFFADGEAAFQEIFHSHLHVFPRFPGDGFTIDARWDEHARDDLEATATAIRDALDDVQPLRSA